MNRLVLAGIGLFFGGAVPPAEAPAASPAIFLFINDDSSTRLSAAPVWLGVPLPEGVLKDPADVRLATLDGKSVPVQAAPLTWHSDGSIRALVLDFQTDVAGAGKQTFRLEHDRSAPRPAFASPVSVAETGDTFRVTTGPLSFTVGKRKASFLEDVRLDLNGDGNLTDDEQVAAGGVDLLASTSAGILHRASLDTESCRAEIEESGPARVTIRCSGWHVSEGGSRFCQYILRIHAFAGKSYVRLQHTFVFTADPETTQLKSLGIVLPLKATAAQVFCGGKAGEPVRCGSPAVWLQDRHDHFAVRDGTKVVAEGKTSSGYMTLSSGRFAATAIVREAWQNFPKAVEASGTGLTVWLWPPHVAPLNMKRYSQTTAGEDACAVESAMGLAKTHEVFLYFHKPDADVTSLAKWVQRRPVALPEPAAMCASGVLGDLCPEDARRFPSAESALRGCMDWLIALRDRFAWYGMIDYGDVARIYNKRTRSWLGSWAEGQGGWEGHNGWMNNEFGYARTPWIMTVRTGEPHYFRFAEAHARHIMDVDTAHYDPQYPWRVGGQHRHGPQHWCDGVGASHTYAIYLPAYYQLTGDRRGLDVIREMSQYYLLNVRPCTLPGEPETVYHLTTENGMQPGRPNPPETSYTNLRPVGAGITGLVKLYEVTNDKRLLERAAEQIHLLCRTQRADGTWDGEPQFDKNNVLRWSHETPWGYASRLADAFSSYCQTVPDDVAAKEAFAKWARACILQGPEHPFGSGLLCAGAYRATGDERFLAYGEAWLLSHAGRPGPDKELGFPQATEGLFDPMRSIPPLLKPLAEWKGPRSFDTGLWSQWHPETLTTSQGDLRYALMWATYASMVRGRFGKSWPESFDHGAGALYLHTHNPELTPDQAVRIRRLQRRRRQFESTPLITTFEEQDPLFGAIPTSAIISDDFEEVMSRVRGARRPWPPSRDGLCVWNTSTDARVR